MSEQKRHQVRFRCPECDRGLRVPEQVIGRIIACPFCRNRFATSFEEHVATVPNHPEGPDSSATDLARVPSAKRWLPTRDQVSGAISKAATSTAAAATNTARKAAAAATPLTQVVTGIASTLLPGAGEVMSGKTASGFATMAAFLGVTAAATAATGGAWIAAPIAISVFSATRGAKAGRELGNQWKESLTDAANAQEIDRIAAEVKRQAEAMSPEEFERLMLEREQAELGRLESEQEPPRKVRLVRVGNK